MIILVATEDELRLAKKHLGEYEIVKTGVGAGNVIRCCSQLLFRKGIENERIVNLGFCGSNSIPVGTVVKVSKTWRLMDNVVMLDGNVIEPEKLGAPVVAVPKCPRG